MNIDERVFQKFDMIEERLKDTCISVARIEQYIKDEREKQTEKLASTDKKLKWFFGFLASAVAVTNIINYILKV